MLVALRFERFTLASTTLPAISAMARPKIKIAVRFMMFLFIVYGLSFMEDSGEYPGSVIGSRRS